MNNYEFHRPFISSLIIIAGITIATMASSRLIFSIYEFETTKTSSFTSASLEK